MQGSHVPNDFKIYISVIVRHGVAHAPHSSKWEFGKLRGLLWQAFHPGQGSDPKPFPFVPERTKTAKANSMVATRIGDVIEILGAILSRRFRKWLQSKSDLVAKILGYDLQWAAVARVDGRQR